MPKNLQRCILLLTALCMLGLSGVHVALVQIYGWATMFAKYSEQMPVRDALAYTFNGGESCGYCAFVETAQENTWQADQFRLQKEVHLLPLQSPSDGTGLHPALLERRPVKHGAFGERTEAPPGPPPRLA